MVSHNCHFSKTLRNGWGIALLLAFLATGWWGGSPNLLLAQDVSLDVTLAPEVESAQVLGLSNLGVSRTGAGDRLVTLAIRNETNQKLENLYFSIDISSGKRGLLVDLDQRSNSPFSLDPNQTIVTDNNSVQDGIAGIEESIKFESNPLTAEGESLINSLEGSTQLPPDTYQVTVAIYQGGNGRSNGTKLTSSTVTLGGRSTGGGLEIYLLTPGDVIGSNAKIQNAYPEFNWDGSNQVKYRLVVVEKDANESPEALIQGALSSDPIIVDGSPGSGSLLSYENLDVLVSNTTNYQYPSSGVQPLKQGKSYYWQIIAQVTTPDGVNEIFSDIWSFKLVGSGGPEGNGIQLSNETEQKIIQLIGQERFNQLESQGYSLQSIQYNGQRFQGVAAENALNAFLNRLANGELNVISSQ
ncbi:MAG: hypothetical protein ACQETE_02770 [Bacteroidota bacterium]